MAAVDWDDAMQSEAFNPVEEPDSFDGMYACDR